MDDRKAALERMRRGIEATDRELVALIARRARQVRAVWAWKRHIGMPLYDAAREEGLIRRWVERACGMGLEPEAVTRLVRELLAVTAPVSRPGNPAHWSQTRQPEGIEPTGSDAMLALYTSDQ